MTADRRGARRRWLWMLLAGGVALYAIIAQAADPDALWKIVHNRCVPGAQAGNPTPCVAVDVDDAVLKDLEGATQFLVIPTARITGIESPAVIAPGAPNFFAAAWQARHYMNARIGHPLPRDDVALAVNPPSARSQEQLHIHVDCIRADVRDILRSLPIGPDWTMLPMPLQDQRYAAMRLQGTDLADNPFQLLADRLPGARDAMDHFTLVVAGSGEAPDAGFILLAGRVGPDGSGHGEDLQDHSCAVATQAE